MKRIASTALCLTVSAMLSSPVLADEDKQYSSASAYDFPDQLLWGDTHLHTNLSNDAFGLGNRTLTSDQAYRFAKGEAVRGYNGYEAQLKRPLDFLVIADHAENLGYMKNLAAGYQAFLDSELGAAINEETVQNQIPTSVALQTYDQEVFEEALNALGLYTAYWNLFLTEAIEDEGFKETVWNEVIENAERHNDPGNFTAFIGYEWTSGGGGAGFGDGDPLWRGNLHRVVIFKDGAEETGQIIPFSALDSLSPEDLWSFLETYEETTGGEVISIPHNGNLSAGEMFALTNFEGRELTTDYAVTRSRWEPLYEMTQIKGDSEAHPVLSPTDEFADYETWNSWLGNSMAGINEETWDARLMSEYARSALKLGLAQQAVLGVNPFKFGMIGSTDAHTSFATGDEMNFWGKFSLQEPSAHRVVCCDDAMAGIHYAASGYAAVWATENTRDSIFAAMKRKEAYATTGPRMQVRFFGGWGFEDDDAVRPDLAAVGYDKGVPMGGDLTAMPDGGVPSFLIRAVKDPDGANLDRVQVVKGWRTQDGALEEKVYNVALSDGREDLGEMTQPVGDTVDLENASYLNSIGDEELAVVWHDPDFDPEQLAFYYVRVLEIPTPRWTAQDARFFNIRNPAPEILQSQQERAYTSPIWYTPSDVDTQ